MIDNLYVIKPYRVFEMWVFDDASVGLVQEPFIDGMPEMINLLLENQKINDAESGFLLMFSNQPFADMLTYIRKHGEGSWYRWDKVNMEGYLCPALFEYFEAAPPVLYIKVEESKG